MGSIRSFSSFAVGDLVFFEQSFPAEAFEAFSALSGDRNPLHHDSEYAASSEFDRPIVPLHMTIAPLSRVAGMHFPGDPSLYLGHEVRSIRPVYFGETLVYSARVTAVNPALRTLTIRVLAIRDDEVVIDCEMRVMSRLEQWEVADEQSDLVPSLGAVLITGATGEIGTALAAAMARRGYRLILLDRGPGRKREALAAALKPHLASPDQIEQIGADLSLDDDLSRICSALAARSDISALFHTASPPIDAKIADLVQVNYSALHQLAVAVVPSMLKRQQGVVAAINSIATERTIPGWDDYTAAKAMSGQYLAGFDKTYAAYGIRGLSVLSGLVATAYSASVQGAAPAMIPEELAQQVLRAALDEKVGQAIVIEMGRSHTGKLGFHTEGRGRGPSLSDMAEEAEQSTRTDTTDLNTGLEDLDQRIAQVVSAKLNLPADAELVGGGLGKTPGWDSLRHIELVLKLESVFGIRFASQEIENMLEFDALCDITRRHLG